MKKLLLFLAVAFICLVPKTIPAFSDTAEILFVNDTSMYLRFYVDGEIACACPAGDDCAVIEKLGSHTLKAVGEEGQTVRRNIELDSGGFTWTVY